QLPERVAVQVGAHLLRLGIGDPQARLGEQPIGGGRQTLCELCLVLDVQQHVRDFARTIDELDIAEEPAVALGRVDEQEPVPRLQEQLLAQTGHVYALPTAAETSAAKSFVSFVRPSPRANRANRRTWMFSPMTAIAALISSSTVRLPSGSLKKDCSSRTPVFWSLKYRSSLPGRILSIIPSGFPCSRSFARSMFFSRSTASWGTSSRRTACGLPHA